MCFKWYIYREREAERKRGIRLNFVACTVRADDTLANTYRDLEPGHYLINNAMPIQAENSRHL